MRERAAQPRCMVVLLLYGAMLLALTPGLAAGASGQLTGQFFLITGGQATVLLYNTNRGPEPRAEQYLRVPELTGGVGEDGGFTLQVDAGAFYLGALLVDGEHPSAGPPQAGDQVCVALDGQGEPLQVRILADQETILGQIPLSCQSYTPVDRDMILAMASDPARATGGLAKPVTGVSGRIVDTAGKPRAGVLVFARQQDGAYPGGRYISQPSDGDGRFLITVPAAGDYQLKLSGAGFMPVRLLERRDEQWQEVAVRSVSLREQELQRDVELTVMPH